MSKNYLEKIKTLVSTAIIMTVLTLMLAGCNKSNSSNSTKTNDNQETNMVEATTSDLIKNAEEEADVEIQDGEYEVYVSLTGGSGKASITSPTIATVKDGAVTLLIEWSSPNYDYMIVNGEKHLPINDGGKSVFEIPVDSLYGEASVIADTVAMGTPHEIEYSINFSQNNLEDSLDDDLESASNKTSNKEIVNTNIEYEDILEWQKNHKVTGKVERVSAERFGITFYDEKYCMIVINGSDYYMLNGEGYSIPEDISEGVTVINVPLSGIDLVSTSTLNYFSCIDALDCISFSSIKKSSCEDKKALEYMEQGKIKYAGKYSAPDYEMLLSGECPLVIENTMITHTPDVLDQLHNIGISTIIDYSSHEPSPIGRMEWIKLYGILTGNLEIAEDVFNEKAANLNDRYEKNKKKVAYFYVSENGGIGIRKNQDYIVKLIDMAGGEYTFTGKKEYDGTGQMTIQKEAFYESVIDCDVLIYNSTINGAIDSKDELIAKCEVLKNTDAFKNDAIYCTKDNIYLSVMSLAEIADDLNSILCGREATDYFYKLK